MRPRHFDPGFGHAVIVAGLDLEAQPAGAIGIGHLGEGDGGRAIGDDIEMPGTDFAPTLMDDQIATIVDGHFQTRAGGVELLKILLCSAKFERCRTAAALQFGQQLRARWHGDRLAGGNVLQQDRRDARVVGRRDPDLQDRRRTDQPLQIGIERALQLGRRVAPPARQCDRQKQERGEAQTPRIVARQNRAGQWPAQLREGDGQTAAIGVPQGLRHRIGIASR